MKYLRYKIGIIVLALASVSCNSWLDVEPIDKMNEDKLYSKVSGFYTALNGVYLGLAERSLYGENLSCGFADVLAQNYDVSGSSHKFNMHSKYAYTDDKVKPVLENIWQKAYFLIANCNYLLKKAEERTDVLTGDDADYVRGEALALRAYLHFDLFRLWGPMYSESQKDYISIPYYTKQTSTPEPLLKASAVLDQVLADLNAAEALLENDPVKTSGQNKGGSEYMKNRHLRMNYFAVLALKARVYLYMGNKTEAYKCASLLLDNDAFKGFFPFVTLDAVNDSKNPDRFFYTEQLFCFQNLLRDKLYTDLFDPQLGEDSYLAPTSEDIVNLYAANDKDYRYKMMWRWNTSGGKAVAFAKFESITDNSVPIRTKVQGMIRLSELYLIAAETASTPAEQVNYLNQLRLHRGYSSASVNIGDDLDAIIRSEYQREFYGEGQFFFHLKRTKVTAWANNTMGEAQYVLPLPDSEKNYRN